MSMHTYIGARYVPRFVGTYDITQSYDALDVVDNGSGTSYIARIPTPAGTPLTDTTYWFLYGSSSGAIVALQNQVNQLSDDVDKLKNRKYIFIGDSYGHAGGNGWIDQLASMLGLSASDYYESAVGGAGFAIVGLQFIDQLTSIASGLTLDEKAEITDIIVLGGANDTGFTPNIMASYINAFVGLANTDFPNAKIYIGMCAGNYVNNVIGLQLARTLDGYQAGSGYTYLHNIEYVLHDRRLVAADHVHPTSDGSERLANFVYAYLTGKSMGVGYRSRDIISITDGTLVYSQTGMSVIENEVASYRCPFISAEFDTVKTITQLQSVNTKININSPLILGITDRSLGQSYSFTDVTMNVSMYSSQDSAWHNINCALGLFNGEIWLTNIDETATGAVDVALRQVKKITIPIYTFTCPSIYC